MSEAQTTGALHEAAEAVRQTMAALNEAINNARKKGLEVEIVITHDGDPCVRRIGYDL